MVVTQQVPGEVIERLTDGIMQTQRLVPVPPLVSYSRILLHNQGWDIQELQPRPKVQSALTSSDDDDVGLDAFEVDLFLSLFRPFSVVRERVPESSNLFGVFGERLQVGINGVGLPDAPRCKYEPKNAVSASPCPNGEGEQGLDPFDVLPMFSDASGLELEVVQTSLVGERGISDSVLEEGFNLVGSVESTEVPRQGQDVSPESVWLEKVQEPIDVEITLRGRRERGLKLFKPFPCDLDGVDVIWRGDTEVFDGREGGDW